MRKRKKKKILTAFVIAKIVAKKPKIKKQTNNLASPNSVVYNKVYVINNSIWLWLLLPFLSWVIPFYYMNKATDFNNELKMNGVKPQGRLNHLIWLWALPIITFFIIPLYYMSRASEYRRQLLTLQKNNQEQIIDIKKSSF